jgi:lauroyl/myristoyl acyltransferase
MKITPFHRLEGWGLATYTQLIQRTARYQVEGWEHVEQALATGRPLIIATWHGMTMMLAGYLTAYDDPGRYVMIAVPPTSPREAWPLSPASLGR